MYRDNSTVSPAVETLLPHSGLMVLLDAVKRWDKLTIECTSTSHQRADNPLRIDDSLPVAAGIEYAAQAMAAHGTLCAMRDNPHPSPRTGYLAVLRKVTWHTDYLHNIEGELLISASQLSATDSGSHYRFSVATAVPDHVILIEGEAIVALENPA